MIVVAKRVPHRTPASRSETERESISHTKVTMPLSYSDRRDCSSLRLRLLRSQTCCRTFKTSHWMHLSRSETQRQQVSVRPQLSMRLSGDTQSRASYMKTLCHHAENCRRTTSRGIFTSDLNSMFHFAMFLTLLILLRIEVPLPLLATLIVCTYIHSNISSNIEVVDGAGQRKHFRFHFPSRGNVRFHFWGEDSIGNRSGYSPLNETQ